MAWIPGDPLANPLRERQPGDPWAVEDDRELGELWRLSATACVGKPFADRRWHRMRWAADQYHKRHPDTCATGAYKRIERVILAWK